jgi:hypothetical protein
MLLHRPVRELRSGFEPPQARQLRGPAPRRRPTRCRLQVEPLESRTLLSGLPRPNAGTGAFALGVQAYIYGYPLVMMGVTQQVMTNAAMAGTKHAPMNQFAYGTLATPAETDVVLPNVNVL